MKTVYISEKGDDKNDGFSPETSVYSWERAKKIKGGDNSIEIFVSADAIQRIIEEADEADRKRR